MALERDLIAPESLEGLNCWISHLLEANYGSFTTLEIETRTVHLDG